MCLTAQAAGHPQAEAQAVRLCPQLGFFAGAFYPYSGCRQGKAGPLSQYGLFAVGAEIAETARFFHGIAPLSVDSSFIIHARGGNYQYPI